MNGALRSVEVDPSTPLLWVLRDELGLTGAKYGCGLEQCGACAVLCDGRKILSCVAPVASFAGRAITTIEGLAGSDELDALQRAFVTSRRRSVATACPGS